jgi:hypothetical protein
VLEDSLALNAAGMPGWATDLRLVLSNLLVPIQCPQSLQLDQEFVDELIEALERSMAAWINEGMDSQKMYLLWGRKELRKDGALFHKTLHLQHYLLLPVADHRKALTRLLVSDHGLALEQMQQGYVLLEDRAVDGRKYNDGVKRSLQEQIRLNVKVNKCFYSCTCRNR